MNLNSSPSKEELSAIISRCDDHSGNHVLWVNESGDVYITSIDSNIMTPVGFEASTPNMKLRYETFGAGNDYVGENAAKDDELVTRLFNSLVQEWSGQQENVGVGYVDIY